MSAKLGARILIITPGPHERTPGFYRVEGGQVLHRLWHDPDFTPLEG